jgi:hypothetical protein
MVPIADGVALEVPEVAPLVVLGVLELESFESPLQPASAALKIRIPSSPAPRPFSQNCIRSPSLQSGNSPKLSGRCVLTG